MKNVVTFVDSGLPIDAWELLDKNSMWAINQSELSIKHWKESPTLSLKILALQLALQGQLHVEY